MLLAEKHNRKANALYLKALSEFPFIKPDLLKKAVVICHRHADVDAYCAAYSVVDIIRKFKKGIDISIATPDGLNVTAKRVANKYPIMTIDSIDFENVDLAVIVDTGHLSLLGIYEEPIKNSNCVKVFLDHHPLSDSIKDVADYIIINDLATSTCELIVDIFYAMKLSISKTVSQVLLTGIIFDSQHLRLVNYQGIKIVSELCGRGASIGDSIEIGLNSRDRSERIARLKGVQRLSLYSFGDWVVGSTEIGSFQASVAKAIIDLGADFTLAVGQTNEGSRCCLRSTQSFHKSTGIHLGNDIAKKIAINMEGVGGGHPTAASFITNTDCDDIVKGVFSILENSLDLHKKKLK